MRDHDGFFAKARELVREGGGDPATAQITVGPEQPDGLADLIVAFPKRVLFVGLVPLKPGEASDPNSPEPGFRCETEAEAFARSLGDEFEVWLAFNDRTGERRSPAQILAFIADMRAAANRLDFDLNQYGPRADAFNQRGRRRS
jgi:hypothetical protein